MSDNTILNPGVNGDVARSIDRAGVKTQVVAIDLGGQAGPENLLGEGGLPITAETLPLPTGAATQATLAALNVIAQAISDAVASLDGKATIINTGAIGGTVASDAPTLAALESITAATGGLTDGQLRATAVPVSGTFWQATQPVSFTWSGLTDAQLRAAAVPISAAALPLPTGAATETTLASVDAKLPALDAGRLPVVLPPGSSGLTNAELRATAVPVDVAGELIEAIEALRMTVHSLSRSIGLLMPDASGRMRAVIETGSTVSVSALPTLATVTTVGTVSTVTNQGQIGGLAANDQIPALLRMGADGLRNNILVT